MAVRTVGIQECERRGPERVMRMLEKLKRSGGISGMSTPLIRIEQGCKVVAKLNASDWTRQGCGLRAPSRPAEAYLSVGRPALLADSSLTRARGK